MSGGEVIPGATNEAAGVLQISYSRRNTSISTLIWISLWYLLWVPVCAVVVYVIYWDPTNYFLWLWLIFGLLGLVLFPLSVLELFTTYTFSEGPGHYLIRWDNFLSHRELQVAKVDFLGFEFDDDDGRESDQLSLVYRKSGSPKRQRLMSFLHKPGKQAVIASLQWMPGKERDVVTATAVSP